MKYTGERYVPSEKGIIRYEHLHRYAIARSLAAGKTVLDIASGEGYGSAMLAEAARDVVGVDIDVEAVAYAAREYAHQPNARFVVGSCDAVPLPDESFDLIVSFETIEHHDRHEEMMREMKRLLKPEGVLVLSSPNRLIYNVHSVSPNTFHVKELDKTELVGLLRNHFRFVRVWGQSVAAGSLVFDIEEPSGDLISTFSFQQQHVESRSPALRTPEYFLAICSDEKVSFALSSVFFDPADDVVLSLRHQIAEFSQVLNSLPNDITSLQKLLKERDEEIRWMKRLKFWRLAVIYWEMLEGLKRLARGDFFAPRRGDYERWLEQFDKKHIIAAQLNVELLRQRPLISLVMLIDTGKMNHLERTLDSVGGQIYKHWELYICCRGSMTKKNRRILEKAGRNDTRIKWMQGEEADCVASFSKILEVIKGDSIALLECGDELAPHALYEMANHIDHDPNADVIYGDEDRIDHRGQRRDPFFKPDWSPDLFLSCNYLGHFTLIRVGALKAVSRYRLDYPNSLTYDLLLRVIETTSHIRHIPRVLIHTRVSGGHESEHVVLQAHLDRKGVAATVKRDVVIGRWRVQYIHSDLPEVSIVIPTGGSKLLRSCVAGVFEKTQYVHFEILVVDNSKEDRVRDWCDEFRSRWTNVRYLDCRRQPFSFSKLNNDAMKTVSSPLALFLNDDTAPIHSDWLAALVEHALRPEVGAVGAQLLYPNDTIQHAGVFLGIGESCGQAFRRLSANPRDHVYFDLPYMVRNCSAVTGACLMTRRDVFWELGGFDESHLPVAFQDVDYCLRLGERGYRIIYTPYSRLYHYESKTKTDENFMPTASETHYLRTRWKHIIAHDPFYSPNLSRSREDYSYVGD